MTQEEINDRFNQFREWCKTHVYSEPDTQMHMQVMNELIPKLVNDSNLTDKQAILDVGCGQGYGMLKFKEFGCTNIQGITLSSEDVKASQDRGFVCTQQDMSFTDFENESFDFLFVRHALEHSPYPLLTLKEFYRLMRVGGGAYIEMPSPKCDRVLENYDNHYSIMGSRQWVPLMRRAGFHVADMGELKFGISSVNDDGQPWNGTEVYEYYLLHKKQ